MIVSRRADCICRTAGIVVRLLILGNYILDVPLNSPLSCSQLFTMFRCRNIHSVVFFPELAKINTYIKVLNVWHILLSGYLFVYYACRYIHIHTAHARTHIHKNTTCTHIYTYFWNDFKNGL